MSIYKLKLIIKASDTVTWLKKKIIGSLCSKDNFIFMIIQLIQTLQPRFLNKYVTNIRLAELPFIHNY